MSEDNNETPSVSGPGKGKLDIILEKLGEIKSNQDDLSSRVIELENQPAGTARAAKEKAPKKVKKPKPVQKNARNMCKIQLLGYRNGKYKVGQYFVWSVVRAKAKKIAPVLDKFCKAEFKKKLVLPRKMHADNGVANALENGSSE